MLFEQGRVERHTVAIFTDQFLVAAAQCMPLLAAWWSYLELLIINFD